MEYDISHARRGFGGIDEICIDAHFFDQILISSPVWGNFDALDGYTAYAGGFNGVSTGLGKVLVQLFARCPQGQIPHKNGACVDIFHAKWWWRAGRGSQVFACCCLWWYLVVVVLLRRTLWFRCCCLWNDDSLAFLVASSFLPNVVLWIVNYDL